nr:hypothetical protein [Tanacetum cinerariifolium]
MCCDIDNVGFGEDDDGVEDEGFESLTVNSWSFSRRTVYEVHRHGTKSLPDPASKKKGRPYWGFVEMVTTNIQDIKDALKGGSDNIHEELGVDIHENSSCSDLINTFGAETSTDALIKGNWV